MKGKIKVLCLICIIGCIAACSIGKKKVPDIIERNIKDKELVIIDANKDKLSSKNNEENYIIINEVNNNVGDAIATAEEFFDAQRTNDYDKFISVLTDDHGFTRENNSDFGVIKLVINDIHFESDSHFETRMLKSEKARELGWNADNMSVVVVNFEAEYDNTKVPTNGGQKEYRFLMIRADENSRWLIQDWGY